MRAAGPQTYKFEHLAELVQTEDGLEFSDLNSNKSGEENDEVDETNSSNG